MICQYCRYFLRFRYKSDTQFRRYCTYNGIKMSIDRDIEECNVIDDDCIGTGVGNKIGY